MFKQTTSITSSTYIQSLEVICRCVAQCILCQQWGRMDGGYHIYHPLTSYLWHTESPQHNRKVSQEEKKGTTRAADHHPSLDGAPKFTRVAKCWTEPDGALESLSIETYKTLSSVRRLIQTIRRDGFLAEPTAYYLPLDCSYCSRNTRCRTMGMSRQQRARRLRVEAIPLSVEHALLDHEWRGRSSKVEGKEMVMQMITFVRSD